MHHLKHGIQDEANIIAIVGFQAEHTLGRRLVEGWDVVPIFGISTPRRAQVVVFNGLSAHADRNDLLAYVRAISPAPQQVFVVHGEEKQALSLGAAIQTEHHNHHRHRHFPPPPPKTRCHPPLGRWRGPP